MSNFNNKSITNKGLELLSAALAGGTLEFTRIVMGSGTYSGDIGVIESLVGQKQSLDIKNITRKGSQVVLSTTLLQSAIVEDFYWKEIGVYAKGDDDVEVLYMYGSATDTSFISKDMLNEKMINVGVLVSNAQNITATIDGSLVYLSRADLEEHNNDETAHKSLREWVQRLFDSLKLTWDSITDKPSTFPPELHNHDNRYYTECEMDNKLKDKANSSHTHDDATTSVSGFMSALDKNKLNGIADNANNYVHPGSGTNPHGTTKTDIGLGSVLNYGVATLAEAQAGTSNAKYMTPYLVKEACKKYGGDIVGKYYNSECIDVSLTTNILSTIKSYSNANGGIVRIRYLSCSESANWAYLYTLVVDGVTKWSSVSDSAVGRVYDCFVDIPFNSSFVLSASLYVAGGSVITRNSRVILDYYINQ